MSKQPPARFPRGLIALHWITLLLLVGVYATMELRGIFPRGSAERAAMKTAHYFLGISVFALTWLRLGLRLSGRIPPITPQPPKWQSALAAVVALALYVLLLAMPIVGYLLLNAEGHAPAIGNLRLPLLIPVQQGLAESLETWHGRIATAGYWLVGVHALAAIYHHHVRRDDALLRMSPRRRVPVNPAND
ncbi:cytochrome b [Pseudoxanthomonas koreensis]|uniref:cytochrome b n=1 Tax=Pseudoxanthomonas koreensis TaxID=266061 RepID=UPI001390FEB2|nr:cytochrome b [Pseudoxanthomonas koreensis]KAF1689809.1 cytochrome B [Pseudoxanthomonas koreensis]